MFISGEFQLKGCFRSVDSFFSCSVHWTVLSFPKRRYDRPLIDKKLLLVSLQMNLWFGVFVAGLATPVVGYLLSKIYGFSQLLFFLVLYFLLLGPIWLYVSLHDIFALILPDAQYFKNIHNIYMLSGADAIILRWNWSVSFFCAFLI